MAFLAPALTALAPAAGAAGAAAAAPAIGAAAAPALGAGLGAASLPAGATALGSAMPWLHGAGAAGGLASSPAGMMAMTGPSTYQMLGNMSANPGLVGKLAGPFPGMGMGSGAEAGLSSKLLDAMPGIAGAMKGNESEQQQFAPASPMSAPMQQNMGMQSPSLMESLNQQTRDDQMLSPEMDLAQLMQRFNHRA